MSGLNYNLPTISGDVVLGFSRFPPGTYGYPHNYILTVAAAPQISLRAGNITALTLSHGGSTQRTVPSADAGSTPELSNIPADALSFNVSNDAQQTSTLRVWCRIDLSGRIYWWLMMVGPGSSSAVKEIAFNASLTLGATTSDVLDDDDNVILKSGEFTFPIRIAIMEKDLPLSVRDACFQEYVVGEKVDHLFSMSPFCIVFAS